MKHSLERHPILAVITVEEYVQLRRDVQFGRVSWPIAWEPFRAPPGRVVGASCPPEPYKRIAAQFVLDAAVTKRT